MHPPNANKKYGGGLYQLKINGHKWQYKKVISGNCYGLLKLDNKLYVIDEERGVTVLNKNLQIVKSFPIISDQRPHGISYHNKSKQFFINATKQDSILVYDNQFNLKKIISITDKNLSEDKKHHVNDNLIINNSLYVSMFCFSGNLKKGIYDGVILKYNLLNLDNKPIVIIKNLSMPHSIKYYNKSLFVLNSLMGEILRYDKQIIGKFPGFTRGLAYNDKYFFIGQSKNRNYSKINSNIKGVAIDSGIIVFNEKNKVFRFCQVDPRISEIHAIEILS